MSEFWIVNSYGYPNPFGDTHGKQAWLTLESFARERSYSGLKKYWASSQAPRKLDHAAVESWKATFEEFGLLYVFSGTDEIVFTPGGKELLAAATAGDRVLFAWVGLSLLLRYPLRGARRSKGDSHSKSDILIYRFLYAVALELDGKIWWSELSRVLCTVFQTGNAQAAVEAIRKLRATPGEIHKYPIPVPNEKGGFYNSLNQVMVHMGMYYLLIGKTSEKSPYGFSAKENCYTIRPEYSEMIRRALGGSTLPSCESPNEGFVRRLPAAPPVFAAEQEYLAYISAPIPPVAAYPEPAPFPEVPYSGLMVPILFADKHYKESAGGSIAGSADPLCRLMKGQRLILDHDLTRTYIITAKRLIEFGKIELVIRPGKPITDPSFIREIMEKKNG